MSENGNSNTRHQTTAEKLGLWVGFDGVWACKLSNERAIGLLTDRDVELMLRREGYMGRISVSTGMTDFEEIRLFCVEHRRLNLRVAREDMDS